MTAALVTRLIGGKTDIIMMLNGALAGLVAITAEPLNPSPILAMVIGSIGAIIMYFGTKFLESKHLDDVVGAIPVHMFAGIFADWDIDGGTYAQNRSAYDAITKMGYTFYTATGGKYAGIKLLTNTAAIWSFFRCAVVIQIFFSERELAK